MAELHRITQPGGVLLLTVHSLPQWNKAISDMENGGEPVDHLRATLEQDGILFISDDHFIGSTHPDFYHTTFHAPWYVFEHWTRWFDVAAYVPLGSDSQDLVVLRRRADDEPHQPPIGHGSGAEAAPAPAASGNGQLPPQRRAAEHARQDPAARALALSRPPGAHQPGAVGRAQGARPRAADAPDRPLRARAPRVGRDRGAAGRARTRRARRLALLRTRPDPGRSARRGRRPRAAPARSPRG